MKLTIRENTYNNLGIEYTVYIDGRAINNSLYGRGKNEQEAIDYARQYIENNNIYNINDCYVEKTEEYETSENGIDFDYDEYTETVWEASDEYELDDNYDSDEVDEYGGHDYKKK